MALVGEEAVRARLVAMFVARVQGMKTWKATRERTVGVVGGSFSVRMR